MYTCIFMYSYFFDFIFVHRYHIFNSIHIFLMSYLYIYIYIICLIYLCEILCVRNCVFLCEYIYTSYVHLFACVRVCVSRSYHCVHEYINVHQWDTAHIFRRNDSFRVDTSLLFFAPLRSNVSVSTHAHFHTHT